MTEYTANELAVTERKPVIMPDGDDMPTFFPAYAETDAGVIAMDQSINEDLYEIGGDGNPIHYDPDMVQVYGEVMPFFDGFPGESLIVQGSAFTYEVIRNADRPAASVSSTFMNAVDTEDTVYWERDTESLEQGEQVTFTLENGDVASTHEVTYAADDDSDLSAAAVADRNAVNAVKPAKAVGADDQQNNLLIQMDASFGDDGESAWMTHEARDAVEDADVPYNLVDRYRYDDGTTVELKLLEPDQALQDEVAAVYDEETALSPMDALVELQCEGMRTYMEQQREMAEAYADMHQAAVNMLQSPFQASTYSSAD